MRNDGTRDSIRQLNDAFRQTFTGGRVMKTVGVGALDEKVQQRLIAEVKAFNRFENGNDPYGEHDFGSVRIDDATFFWKIEYYDLAMHQGSVDPSNDDTTLRVLTIMRSDEY